MNGPTSSELRDLALCVGEDLDGLSEAEIATKVRECPHCRSHWQRLNKAQSALRGLTDACDLPHDSVWPDVAPRLKSCLSRRAARSSWMQASVATAAAVVALVTISRFSAVDPRNGGIDRGFGPTDRVAGVEVDRRDGREVFLRFTSPAQGERRSAEAAPEAGAVR